MAYLTPKTIVVDFLRKNITDPRARLTNTTNSIIADLGQTVFNLTPSAGKKFSHINTVEVDSILKVKWQDYYIDPKNQRIVFFNPMGGSEEVVVDFGEGSTNWIYDDKPKVKLDALSFPRMNVMIVTAPGIRLGNYEAPVEAVPRVQIDIWTKEKQNGQIFEIDGDKYTGERLAEYLSWQINKAFEENESELFPALYGYDPVGMSADLPFDEELQCHHKVVECVLRGVSMGRIN